MFAYRWPIGLSLLLVHSLASALNWPDVAPPCNTTLQACIDAAPSGGTVQVMTSAVLNEGQYLRVLKPLSLVAAPGRRPVLAAGTAIIGSYSPGVGVNWSMTIAGFSVLDGTVIVNVGSGNANVDLHDLDVQSYTAVPNVASGIAVRNNGTGTVNTEIARNRVRVSIDTVSQPPGVYVDSFSTGTVNAAIHDNRIVGLGLNPISAIVAYMGGISTAKVYANQISGVIGSGIAVTPLNSSTSLTSIIVSNAVSCSSTSTGSGYFTATALSGSYEAQIFNNTFVGCNRALGISNTGTLTGRFANNLIAYNQFGVMIPVANEAGFSNDHNAVFGNTTNSYTPGPGTLTADPLLVRGTANPRLTAASAALGAADSVALRNLMAARGIADIDADGLRRFKGSGSVADIGAFEYGDISFGQRISAGNTSGSVSTLDNPALNGLATARPLITATRMSESYPALTNPHLTSLDFGTNYRIRNLDAAAFVLRSAYHVLAPAVGDGVLLHTSTPANVFGFGTQINDPTLNGQPDRIVLAAHRGTTFAHPFGASYAFGNWFLFQSDAITGGSFPVAQSFHVYAQAPSLNAFHWIANEAGTTSYTVLDQLLINGEPCARIHIQSGYNAPNPHATGLRYVSASGRWRIENLDGAILPSNADFYIVVDEAETAQCRYDHIFHNEFETLD